MELKNYAVFQLRIASELCKKGFNCVKVTPDRKNPRYNVYYFQQEEGLEEEVKKLAASR